MLSKNSMQSDEKYICVSAAQSLCGIALIGCALKMLYENWDLKFMQTTLNLLIHYSIILQKVKENRKK